MANEKRLIDANELLHNSVWICGGFVDDPYSDGYMDALDKVETVIREFPAVDAVEVKHGYWVGTRYDGYADGCPVYDLWECSECREEYESEGDPPPYNYCPNCGAKMGGDGNGT